MPTSCYKIYCGERISERKNERWGVGAVSLRKRIARASGEQSSKCNSAEDAVEGRVSSRRTTALQDQMPW